MGADGVGTSIVILILMLVAVISMHSNVRMENDESSRLFNVCSLCFVCYTGFIA